uniref:Peptidase S1 domain-containing protein n=1 Tax=Ditylenchus dipsaci TaxID=166011 RepID=A0A915E0N5_9BILA
MCGVKLSPNVPHNRIIGGRYVDENNSDQPAYYSFMAALTAKEAKGVRTFCSAVFISKSHIITAKHCIIGLKEMKPEPVKVELRVGGRCPYMPSEREDLIDAVAAEMDFALFDSTIVNAHGADRRYLTDFAIVQLKEKISEELWRTKVKVACLPDPNTEIPEKLVILGFGDKDVIEGRKISFKRSPFLSQATVQTKPLFIELCW